MMIARWTLPVALEYDARIWRRKRALVTWTSRYVASGVCSAPPVAGERSGQTTADASSPPEKERAARQRCN